MKGFTVTRHFRGADYHITVDNSAGAEKGIKSAVVDGNPVELSSKSVVLPVFGDGKVHQVNVIMGEN
jgi:cellobiose phosphorylase